VGRNISYDLIFGVSQIICIMYSQHNRNITKREYEVLNLVAHEYTTPQIALHLYLSAYTVDNHKKNLKIKLEVKNTAGMVRRGFEQVLLRVISSCTAQIYFQMHRKMRPNSILMLAGLQFSICLIRINLAP